MLRNGKKLGLILGAVVAMGVASSQPALAAPIQNGSFENAPDLVNWTPLGNTSVQLTNDFTATVPDGSQEAFLSNFTGATPGSTGATTNIASLDAFVNLTAGTLEGQGVKSGSAIKQTFTAAANDTITFSFNFGTNDLTNADFAFVALQGPGASTAETVFAKAGSSPTPALINTSASPDALFTFGTMFNKETGFLTRQITVGAAGTYTLAFGIANATDTTFTSGVVIDNVVQAAGTGGGGGAVPLPAGMYLMPLGLAVAGLFAKKFRSLVA
jgi:hypothetical protein